MGERPGSKGYNLTPFPRPVLFMIHADHDDNLRDDEEGLPPSKSQRKRDMHALQDLGEQLVALSVGQLMRHIDPEPIQAQLDVFNGLSKAEVARQHRLERLRADLLDDEKVLQ